MSFRIEFPLQGVSPEDARARLGALGEYFTRKHNIQVTWSGDRAAVKGKYLVVAIDGSMWIENEKAIFDGKDPGFLWRGKARDYLQRKLSTYLDPKTKLEDLPRG